MMGVSVVEMCVVDVVVAGDGMVVVGLVGVGVWLRVRVKSGGVDGISWSGLTV